MSEIDPGKLFPKWLFEEDRDFIYIRYNNIDRKFYKHFICSHGMTDVYNSIDYIINFLELNGFLQDNYSELKYNLYRCYNKKYNIYVFVYIDKYTYMIDKTHYDCNSDELLSKLKEILDIELRNKPISNQ